MSKPGIRGSRLVLVVLAAALAVGLLTSIVTRPEPALTASEACYGFCSQSETVLAVSPPVAFFGFERVVTLMVEVSDRGGEQPTGQVVVRAGRRVLCRIELHHGEGSCSLRNRELRPGDYAVVAHYRGNNDIRPSNSPAETLIILGGFGRRAPRTELFPFPWF
jgi:hypothetical protein